MTIVNACVLVDRVLMAADTLSCWPDKSILRGPDGWPQEDTKLIALPAAGLVLTTIGALQVRHDLQRATHRLKTFDHALEVLPGMLKVAYRRAGEDASILVASTCVAAGWSERLGQMALVDLKAPDFEPTVHHARGCGLIVWMSPEPPPGMLLATPLPKAADSMLELARRQLAHYRGIDPAAPAGGRLVLADVTRHTITMSVAGDLGMPAMAC